MKLVEIKNSLAKLYYEPSDFKLVLSDFLTIDDGNQKILSQVVSIEATSKDTTNCAVLKFSLDLNDDGSFSAYSGYVPTLDALVSLTPQKVLQDVFSGDGEAVNIGKLTNSSALQINLKSSIIDNFLYIQSDRYDNKQEILSKILSFNYENNSKTIYVDFESLYDYDQYNTVSFGKDFKLPIDSAVLNYIYEYDLAGLTVEQKAIVQDIIVEIQEYIDSLEEGFIPFDTLMDVVNDIYETDKSVGVILFRNKLLKYKQSELFASNTDEICSIDNAFKSGPVVVVDLSRADKKWQSEALNFILNFIQDKYYLVFEAFDDVVTKEQLNEIYRNKDISPIVLSKYDIAEASDIKSFAKNLILYKPSVQQRAFATYNSFLNKLADKEFIVSGECTYYTPLIIKELSEKIVYAENTAKQIDENISLKIKEIQSEPEEDTQIIVEPVDNEIAEDIAQNIDLLSVEGDYEVFNINFGGEQDDVLQENDLEELIEFDDLPVQDDDYTDLSNIPNILEESIEETIDASIDEISIDNIDVAETPQPELTVEDEIAKDVDEMFYAKNPAPVNNINEMSENNDNMVSIDVDLVDAIDADEDLVDDNLFDESQYDFSQIEDVDISETYDSADALMDDDLDFIDTLEDNREIEEPDLLSEREKTYVDIEPMEEIVQSTPVVEQSASKKQTLHQQVSPVQKTSVPVYKTELDNKSKNRAMEIVEGNIVYHEKYGRGVVEQFMNYGNKRFCSIMFDNVGRRLMDPQLAELKQM